MKLGYDPVRETLTFKVGGVNRTVPLRVWSQMVGLPHPQAGFECNGCSCSPDTLFGVPIWIACVIHDFHYSVLAPLGGTWHARREADRALAANIRMLFALAGKPRWLGALVARLYYGRVRIWGASHFVYDEGEEARGFVQRVREVWGAWKPSVGAIHQVLHAKGVGRTKP